MSAIDDCIADGWHELLKRDRSSWDIGTTPNGSMETADGPRCECGTCIRCDGTLMFGREEVTRGGRPVGGDWLPPLVPAGIEQIDPLTAALWWLSGAREEAFSV